jgi:hypothetical protein
MPSFDFISSPDFRQSLELDYAEMSGAVERKAWKSVQVLAGSIIEALLIDYLLETNDPRRPGKDVLKLDLAEAIALCQSEQILSTRSAELSSVVKSYRNLIHPARIVRLGEEQPSRSSAAIAIALVDLIIDEVAKRRQQKFGLTSDQVLVKIERDSNCLPLLKHLLAEVSSPHRERLLLDLIPNRYIEIATADDDNPFSEESAKLSRIQKAFRIVHELATDPTKQKAAASFVAVLREADGDHVARYQDAFFHPADVKYVAEPHRAIVKQYFLSLAKSSHITQTAEMLADLTPFLIESEVRAWADPYIRTALLSTVSEETKTAVQRAFVRGFDLLPYEREDALRQRLKDWESHFKSRNLDPELGAIQHLQSLVEDSGLPF